MRIRFSTLLLLATLPLCAQQPPTGATISGTVICADTNAPARFAKVMLRPAAIDSAAVESNIQEMQKRMNHPPPHENGNLAAMSALPLYSD